jgi:hypothetical protein
MEPLSSTASHAQPAPSPNGDASYSTLVLEGHAALEARFARGTVLPADFLRISGTPRGRVLSVPALEALGLASLVRAYCGSKLFPWDGKSFTAKSALEGRGVNRWRLPARGDAFAFRTELTASRVDGGPCIAIDYDVPENPGFVRRTYDELRAVGPSLYLGRGMVRAGKPTPSLVLWFLVDTRP